MGLRFGWRPLGRLPRTVRPWPSEKVSLRITSRGGARRLTELTAHEILTKPERMQSGTKRTFQKAGGSAKVEISLEDESERRGGSWEPQVQKPVEQGQPSAAVMNLKSNVSERRC